VSLEIELRFDVGPDDLARLARTPEFAGLTAGHPATCRLSTVYYDTPEMHFAKAGFGLRVRKTGKRYVQTVKSESAGALAAERGEYESRLPSPAPDLRFIPDPDVREKLQAIAGGAPVEAVIETDIRRTTRALTTATGDEIELALDRGEIRTLTNDPTIVPVSEVELELKRGSPAALYDVARILAHEAHLLVNLESKAERGLRAMEGEAIAAKKAGRVELSPDATAEEAFRASLAHCLRHIARNTGAVAEAEDPEGVHQLRVGLRRLRVALRVLGDPFRVGPFEGLRARAKVLADTLAPTRELDVFAADLFASADAAAKKPDLTPLRDALEELRHESWKDAIGLVRSGDFTGFLLDLATAIETRAWRESATPEQLSEYLRPARALAGSVLDQRMKKAKKRAKHLSKLDAAERHALRIALKKLRYTAEFFAPVFDAKTVSAFLNSLSKLQDLFGALNDASTVEHILDRIAARMGTETQDLAEASAFVLGWHQSRIPLTWQKARKRWKSFAKTEPFWAS
jgi:inorganic triphosphatase YgiF